MELFRLTCVTCQAHLSVRDRAIIGKILSCPRCGSMVQVNVPAELAGNGPGLLTAPEQYNTPTSQFPVSNAQPSDSSLQQSAEGHFDQEERLQEGIQEESPEMVPIESAWKFVQKGHRYQVVAWSLAGTVAAGMLVAVFAWSQGKGSANRVAIGGQVEPNLLAGQRESVSRHPLVFVEEGVHSEASETANLTESIAADMAERTSLDAQYAPESNPGNISVTRIEPDVNLPEYENSITNPADAEALPALLSTPAGAEISAEKAKSDTGDVVGAKSTTQVVGLVQWLFL